MKIEQARLIDELLALTQTAKQQALELKTYDLEALNYKPNDQTWSALECLEHLNRYGQFYLPELDNKITGAPMTHNAPFKSGWLGNYFVNMIKASNLKKLKTTPPMDTTGSDLNLTTIDQFVKQLDWLQTLLQKAVQVDLTRTKTAISLTKWIKLRLGDTLRFLVYHNERHILQAQRVVAQHPMTV